MRNAPPRLFLRFFRWYCHPRLVNHIEGDLVEIYNQRLKTIGKRKADGRFIIDVFLLLRPGIIRPVKFYSNVNHYDMFKSYFKVGWRNLLRSKGFSIINIVGLAMGMTVAILIGLWMHDELTFNTHHKNYDRIAQVMQHQIFNGEISTQTANPGVLSEEIRNVYGSDFKYVAQTSWNYGHTLAFGDKMLQVPGSYAEQDITHLLGLEMTNGSADGLEDINAILIAESTAEKFFGDDDPIGKVLRIDNRSDLQVAGVYKDLPANTTFRDLNFIVSWELFLQHNAWVRNMKDPWGSNFSQTFALIADHANMDELSEKIRDVKYNKVSEDDKRFKSQIFLHPMSKWHLYSEFKNGVNTGGRIGNVWLFGITGVFVLVLACINFMNLSTARSEKRSKEVGIRKSIGSARSQLITQFFSESVLVALFAFVLSISIVAMVLPTFNQIAEKQLTIRWSDPLFWILGISFSVLTGLFAGLYPAVFLSSFQPVKVLKGTYKAGRFASLPRQVLVVVQFAISVTLVIGTLVVYKQIKHGEKRPLGYNSDGLVNVMVNATRLNHAEVIRNELKSKDVISEMAGAGSPLTEVWNSNSGFDWEGKDPALALDFANTGVTYEYGKTVGWEIKQGRDFSKELISDSAAFILNESAVNFMGLKYPVGKVVRWDGQPFTIIGVVKDLLVQSPYMSVKPSIFHLSTSNQNVFIFKLNPDKSVSDAMSAMESVFKKHDPATPFEASFVDDDYARKFGNEKRVGTVAAWFAALAVFVSCLGLFGLASFVAEQRTKEIGIRKVMGASVIHLWQMLSKDFVILVLLACFIAIPIAWYYLEHWLASYEYRTNISLWIFVVSAAGALTITLITVSLQAIKAALINPVKSLRSE
jgi:putative ABC transport system permease protein